VGERRRGRLNVKRCQGEKEGGGEKTLEGEEKRKKEERKRRSTRIALRWNAQASIAPFSRSGKRNGRGGTGNKKRKKGKKKREQLLPSQYLEHCRLLPRNLFLAAKKKKGKEKEENTSGKGKGRQRL